MATIQDRRNPSRKASVDVSGALLVRGPNADGSIGVTEGGDEILVIDDYTTTDMTYICYAAPGTLTSAAEWKIKRLDESGNYPVILYANGSDSYTNIADNRAGLSYS